MFLMYGKTSKGQTLAIIGVSAKDRDALQPGQSIMMSGDFNEVPTCDAISIVAYEGTAKDWITCAREVGSWVMRPTLEYGETGCKNLDSFLDKPKKAE